MDVRRRRIGNAPGRSRGNCTADSAAAGCPRPFASGRSLSSRLHGRDLGEGFGLIALLLFLNALECLCHVGLVGWRIAVRVFVLVRELGLHARCSTKSNDPKKTTKAIAAVVSSISLNASFLPTTRMLRPVALLRQVAKIGMRNDPWRGATGRTYGLGGTAKQLTGDLDLLDLDAPRALGALQPPGGMFKVVGCRGTLT